MPLGLNSDRFELRYSRALPLMIVHRLRLIATRGSLIHPVPLQVRSDCRSPLRNAPLGSDVPLHNHKLHAQDADVCTGHRSVNSDKPLVIVAANMDTLSQCATPHPAPCASVSRTTRLLQSHNNRRRYIAGMILLIVFFSAQAH